VSLEPPCVLLLEVSGSLKLLGGIEAIKAALEEEFQRRQLTARLCVAPTALAALWLAREGLGDVQSPEELVGRLGVLPLRVTGWPDKTQLRLKKMGVETIGDCLRLPRDGFIRRIGRQYLQDLDKSLGQFDLRPEFKPAQRLSSVLEFHDEVTEPAILANAGKVLIEKLVKTLQKRQAQIQNLQFSFHHLHGAKTVERITLAVPSYEGERITRLFLGRLETLSLAGPAIALSLRTGKLEPMVGLNSTLLPDRTQSALKAAMGELIERLRARLGAEEVYGVTLVEEHRPERTWKSKDPLLQGEPDPSEGFPRGQRRPLWILPAPKRLPGSPSDLPHYQGGKPLRLDSEPERIEAGWWKGEDIGRDYYVASSSRGEKLWVYRDRRIDRGWYLHGIFG